MEELTDDEYRYILEALEKADSYFTLWDMMNSRVHCDEPRFSPLTKLVKEALRRFKE